MARNFRMLAHIRMSEIWRNADDQRMRDKVSGVLCPVRVDGVVTKPLPSQTRVCTIDALASGWLPRLCREGVEPSGLR